MSNGLVTICPKEKFDKVITSLMAAVDNEGTQGKKQHHIQIKNLHE
jgi:hypothetical protein